MKDQIEIDGKIFKVGNTIERHGYLNRLIINIGESKYFYSNVKEEDAGFIANLNYWSVKKPEREKIELKAYVGDCGLEYLTDKGEVLLLSSEKNYLYVKSMFCRFSPIPELPNKFMWADNLEYCDSEAGNEGK